jgi:NMD protein affecting ribosome stability and mRNA decay
MSTRACLLCGEPLNQRDTERSLCLLCLHRTSPQERAAQVRRLSGLLDSA